MVEVGDWAAYDLTLDHGKLKWMWDQICNHPALRAQYGRIGAEGFVEMMTDPTKMFFEVWRRGEQFPAGIVYFTDMMLLQDVEVHVIFYDSSLTTKVGLGKKLLRWLFENFPVVHVGVSVPRPFGATIRFVFKLGFKHEGTRRKAALIKGVWQDMMMFGLLRTDLEA